MKIRCKGSPQHTERRFLCRAVRYYAKYLFRSVDNLEVQIVFADRPAYEGGTYWMDRHNRPRRFQIVLRASLSEQRMLEILAHEMVHVWQYASGRMSDVPDDGTKVKWHGIPHNFSEATAKEYYFSPWEKEAFGLQFGLSQSFLEHYNRKK